MFPETCSLIGLSLLPIPTNLFHSSSFFPSFFLQGTTILKLVCICPIYVFLGFFFCFFFLTSLLEYNCFTMVCQFLLYNKMNQLYVYIYTRISSLLCLPPTLSIPPLQVVTKHHQLCFNNFTAFVCIQYILKTKNSHKQ